jgi:hypothetical protein
MATERINDLSVSGILLVTELVVFSVAKQPKLLLAGMRVPLNLTWPKMEGLWVHSEDGLGVAWLSDWLLEEA